MAARRACWDIGSQDLRLPENITFERIGIYDHLTPKLQALLHIAPTTSKLNMITNFVGQKMQLSSFARITGSFSVP